MREHLSRRHIVMGVGLLVGAALSGCAADPAAACDRALLEGMAPEQGWSVVVLPDTQYYASRHPEIFDDQLRWVADNVEHLNIRFVLHVGDVTSGNTPEQWEVARAAFSYLDGTVPYVLVPGNHDYYLDRVRLSRITDYFPPEELSQVVSFGGVFEDGMSDNSYHLFDVDGQPWLVLALEWGPRDVVLEWADAVLTSYPDHNAIVLTHAYLYRDGTRYDWATHGDAQQWNPHAYDWRWPEVNDGEETWAKLVARHDHVRFVLCGHAHGANGRQSSVTHGGSTVHELHSNYQDGPNGGDGYLRVMRFLPGRVAVDTYSPTRGDCKNDRDNRFTLARNDLP